MTTRATKRTPNTAGFRRFFSVAPKTLSNAKSLIGRGFW